MKTKPKSCPYCEHQVSLGTNRCPECSGSLGHKTVKESLWIVERIGDVRPYFWNSRLTLWSVFYLDGYRGNILGNLHRSKDPRMMHNNGMRYVGGCSYLVPLILDLKQFKGE